MSASEQVNEPDVPQQSGFRFEVSEGGAAPPVISLR
jgi:hypothetical protein